jgi:hypothetical protein
MASSLPKDAIELPNGTKIRISRNYHDNRLLKAPKALGGVKEYEDFYRGRKRVEARKKLRVHPI